MNPSLVIVGAGPRGTGFLERLAAALPGRYGDRPLDVHLVDPHPPGPGRIWRTDRSPLLWTNSRAGDVTLFTDDTVPLEGPVRPGPTLAAWSGTDGRRFATRPEQGAYLRWAYERARDALPAAVTLHEHRTTALRDESPREGRQRVRLAGRAAPLPADLVVLALGHPDAEPDAAQRELAAFAARHGLVHLPPGHTAELDLAALPPGRPVLVRGLGLAFVDLMVLLTEGRGGRYEGPEDAPVYVPSGREPVLYAGSRRGVPYHAKTGYVLDGERPPLPRFFGPRQVDALLAGDGPLDFRRDVWPHIARELGWAHYHRLFAAHSERTARPWAAFEAGWAAAAPDGPGLAALVAAAVPDPADRFDPEALDHPLDGLRLPGAEALQEELRARIAAGLSRRHDPARSADAAVVAALDSVYGQLGRLAHRVDTGAWWHGYYSHLASGPPGSRLRRLLALSEAGVVRFLGPRLTVAADERRGVFRASSPAVPGAGTEARALVEARLETAAVPRAAGPLLRGLAEDGAAVTPGGLLAVDPADGRILQRDGRPHPRRIALGPYTTAGVGGGFTRPRSGGRAFAQNDAAAHAALALLRDGVAPGAPRTGVEGWNTMSDTHDSRVPDGTDGPDGADPRAADWRHWHEQREAAVASSYGPLSLTGTHWLADFPDGRLPDLPGEWREDGDEVVLTADAGDGLTVDGEPFAGTVRLTADHAPVHGSRVGSGGRRLMVLRREGLWAVRDFDPESAARRAFRGIEATPYDPRWAVPGVYRPYEEALSVRVENADGRERGLGLTGEVVFELDGRVHALQVAVEDDGTLWAVFADATSGRSTFRFRFLRPAAPAEDGTVTVDLNRALLPPCAFADHFICPFPPPGNTLDLAVEAGERRVLTG